jgi:hypothetical protein
MGSRGLRTDGAPNDTTPNGTVLHRTGVDHDEYVKVDGEWKINLTGYDRIF